MAVEPDPPSGALAQLAAAMARIRPPLRASPISSDHAAAQQQVAGHVHRLHGVVLAAPVGMVVGGGEFPGSGHIGLPQPTGQGQAEALAGDDRVQLRRLAKGGAVGGTEARAAATASLALAGILAGRLAESRAALARAAAASPLVCFVAAVIGGRRAAHHQGADWLGGGGHRPMGAPYQPPPSTDGPG